MVNGASFEASVRKYNSKMEQMIQNYKIAIPSMYSNYVDGVAEWLGISRAQVENTKAGRKYKTATGNMAENYENKIRSAVQNDKYRKGVENAYQPAS